MPELAGMGGGVGSFVNTLASAAISDCLLGEGQFGKCTWESFIQLLLDPWDLWFSSLFKGRPKVGIDSATDSDALFLLPSANPVVALWGLGIRELEALGIPISVSGGPGVATYQRLGANAQADLIRQFGQPEGGNLFSQYATLILQCTNPASNAACIATRAILDSHYPAAIKAGRIDPGTGFPPVTTPPLPTCRPGTHRVGEVCRACDYAPDVNPCPPPLQVPPQCPPGSQFDPRTEKCTVAVRPVCPPNTIGVYPVCKPISVQPVPKSACNCV